MAAGQQRIHIIGPVGIDAGGTFTGQRALPGRQGRLLFALLVVHRGHALTREEIADHLWPRERPRSWDGALSALLSKLRPVLNHIQPTGSAVIKTAFGAHQLRLPADVWIDVECAPLRLDEAEAAFRDGDLDGAWVAAHTTWSITSRPFLVGEDSPWVIDVRGRLEKLRMRALSCLADVWIERGELEPARSCAREVIAIDPFREDAYRRLMAIHLRDGNPAAALDVYERCRCLLAEQLGANPGIRTQEVYQQALASS